MNNIEEKFYKTFGLEPFCDLPCNKRGVECTDNTYCGNKYPDITAEKLLELICIMRTYQLTEIYREVPSVDKLKEDILKWFINQSVINEKIKKQIQQLFKD